MDWLYHENNIKGKIARDYKGRGRDFEIFHENKYLRYKGKQLAITSAKKTDVLEKSRLLNEYLVEIDRFNKGNWITQQSKFRPTVYEEFLGFLFKDEPQLKKLGLAFFNKGLYAGLSIGRDGNPKVIRKDIDFSIGKEITTLFGEPLKGIETRITVPLVAVEAKTYIDKTMFNEAQYTAEILKRGNPDVKVYVFAGTNEIDLNQIPSYSPLDEVFIVTGPKGISGETVYDFFSEVGKVLDGYSEEKIVLLPGRLFGR